MSELPTLTDEELYSRHDEMLRRKKEAHTRIYTRCINAIREACKKGNLTCSFQIPTAIIMGLPYHIDRRECAKDVVTWLRQSNSNIRVKCTASGLLTLDWRRKN